MAIPKIDTLAEYTTVSSSSFVSIVDINELPINAKNKKITVNDLRTFFYTNQNGSSSFTKRTSGFYYFGDNSDGPGNFSGSITALRTRISRSFSSSLDGPPVIKNFSSLFVSQSVVISPPQRCRGMLIFVDGDATISGSITMTARGAKFTGSDASFTVMNPPYLGDYWSRLIFPSGSYMSRIYTIGAQGGIPSNIGTTCDGLAGGGGKSGGGGAGGPGSSGYGLSGTAWSGGSGGGGGVAPSNGTDAQAYGGKGGNSGGPVTPGVSNSGAGAGNPAGTGGPAPAGEGTGGLLILIVRGNLKIGPNANITANGTNGAPASGPNGGGGGASGGGLIYIYYGGTLTNNGTVTSNGGNGGLNSANPGRAGNGGVGTVVLSNIIARYPIAN